MPNNTKNNFVLLVGWIIFAFRKLFNLNTMTPEQQMKIGFDALRTAREAFEAAIHLYQKRNDSNRADDLNAENTLNACYLLDKAYDEISAIWENDINV